MARLSDELSTVVTGTTITVPTPAASEKNYSTSPDSVGSGWVSSDITKVLVATETNTSLIPELSKGTAIRITRVSGTDGYIRYRFAVDVVDQSQTLKVQWQQRYAGSTGDYVLELYSNTASDYSGSYTSISPSVSPIQTLNSRWTVTWSSSTATYYELRIRAAAGTTPLYLSGVIVGPGQAFSAPAISEWQSYTPTWTNLTIGNGTSTGAYRRVGSSMEIRAKLVFGSTTTIAGSPTVALPSGFTIDITSLPPVSNTTPYGLASFGDSGSQTYYGIVNQTGANTTNVVLNSMDDSGGSAVVPGTINATTPFTWTTTDTISAQFTVPIAEWAGSGVITVGPGADVEYAYNTSTATGAGDTTSFGSGSAGALIQNITTDINRRVRFQYPIQTEDVLTVEISEDRTKWYPATLPFRNSGATYGIIPWQLQNATGYGLGRITQVNATDIDVQFGTYSSASGATYAAAGQAWSVGGGAAYWRVRKAKSTALVGVSSSSTGGGLTLSTQTSSFTAAIGNHYLVSTASGPVTVSLPQGSTITGTSLQRATIKLTDDTANWAVSNVIITPFSGDTISTQAPSETLILDISGTWVELSWDGTRWVLASSIAGLPPSGAREKNYVTSPSEPTGWVAAGVTVAATTTAGELPEAYSKGRGIKFSSGSSGQYGYFQFRVDPADLSKKIKIAAYIRTSTSPAYVAGDFEFRVFSDDNSGFTTPTQITVSTAAIPLSSGGQLWEVTFDTSTDDYYQLRVVRATTSTSTLTLSGVTVGPTLTTQSAAISEWQSYTPVINGITTSVASGRYRRVGSSMEIEASFTASAASTSTISVRIPSGYTIDTTALSTTGGVPTLGAATARITSVNYQGVINYANAVSVLATSGTANWWGDTASTPGTWANGSLASFNFAVPIAEWSGQGVVNLGPASQVEYAYNSSVTTATDTTSFASGAGGVLIQSFAPAGTASVAKRVRFQYPLQADDTLRLEVDNGTGGARWVSLAERVGSFTSNDAGSTYYGFQTSIVNSTDVDVNFFSAPYVGSSWASINTWRWRMVKVKAASPVGFGLANADGTSGLYRPGYAPGLIPPSSVTTSFPVAGAIGEYREFYSTSLAMPASGVVGTVGTGDQVTISLTPGVWDITGMIEIGSGSTITFTSVNIWPGTATGTGTTGRVAGANLISWANFTVNGSANGAFTLPVYRVNLTTTTPFYLKVQLSYTGGTITSNAILRATRVA